MKQLKKKPAFLTREQLKPVDYLYYWQGARLVYYGELPNGSQRVIHCKDITALEQLLNYRENEQAGKNK